MRYIKIILLKLNLFSFFSLLKLKAKHIFFKSVEKNKLSLMIYLSFSKYFQNEAINTISGINEFNERVVKNGNIYQLRRNIHRIEKALLMVPLRDVFAEGYILETVDHFKKISTSTNIHSNTLYWAASILNKYFSVVDKNKSSVIKTAYDDFDSLQFSTCTIERKEVPYIRENNNSVSFEDFRKLATQRRSIRFFKDKPVDNALIDKALECALLSPSACNRQPYKYHIVKEKKLIDKFSKLPLGTAGFAENIPTLAIITGDQSAYYDVRDRHVIYIDASLSVMSLCYALETMGLSACCINWPDIPEKEETLREMLCLEKYEKAIMFLAIGYPDSERLVAKSTKKELSEVRKYYE